MSRASAARKPHRTTKYKVTKSVDKVSSAQRLEDITLFGSKLKFCPDQLQNLNFIFRQKVERHLKTIDESYILAKSVAERFIQRLVCCIGRLDERFCCKYLVTMHGQDNITSKNITYLFRIDALSTPTLYESDPEPGYEILEKEESHQGYSKVTLYETMMKDWGEFANCAGYLRRDKVQSKVVQLLAKAAVKTETISSAEIDESILCGSSGKVVDAATLNRILHTSTERHIYYGAGASNTNFPNPKDFRIAIVDEPDGIRVHLEFLSPALSHVSLDVRLLVGIGIDNWATSTDFPFRISLGHTDCLLYHVAARSGMYLVGYGVHSSAWQIRFPAAENIIINHYSPESTTRTVLKVTSLILAELKAIYEDCKQMNNNILTENTLRTALFYELENDKCHPTNTIINWSPQYLSTLVLKILDKLVLALQKEHYQDYFFPTTNVIANPGHLCEDDYQMECYKIQQYMTKLFDDSLSNLANNNAYARMVSSIRVETMLLGKWKEVVDKMSPPRSTRARRMSFTFATNGSDAVFTQYTYRQMEYIGLLLKNVLSVRENIWKNDNQGWIRLKKQPEHPVEDIIYLLVTILEQARDNYISKCADPKIKEKLRLNFYVSTNKLVQLVRRDVDVSLDNIQDDIQMVKIILKWLYKSMDQSKKYFAPILRPYLNMLFTTSHAVSWHIEDMKKSFQNDELDSLGIFAELINKQKLSPARGLVDAYNKKWIWAKDMLELLEKGKLRVILIPRRGNVCRYTLSAASCKRDVSKGSNEKALTRSISFSTRSYFDTLLHKVNLTPVHYKPPIHNTLKEQSPMTYTVSAMHRNGDHRCAGDVFRTLFSMHRLNILQEIAATLHQNDRSELLTYIQTLVAEKEKKRSNKVWSKTLPHPQQGVLPSDNSPKEKYTAIEESAGIKVKERNSTGKENDETDRLFDKLDSRESLLGSCRAARIRDNRAMLYFQEDLKVGDTNTLERFTKPK